MNRKASAAIKHDIEDKRLSMSCCIAAANYASFIGVTIQGVNRFGLRESAAIRLSFKVPAADEFVLR